MRRTFASRGGWSEADAPRPVTGRRSVLASGADLETVQLVGHAFSVWKPERLGFVREGVLRDAERIENRYIDHVLYSVLARDWNDQ